MGNYRGSPTGYRNPPKIPAPDSNESHAIPLPPRTIRQMKRVLHATDFTPASSAAFQVAIQTCQEFSASLLLLHVCERARSLHESTQSPDEHQIASSAVQEQLCELSRQAMNLGLGCDFKVASGTPHQSILETIASNEIDLAILGTRAPHGRGLCDLARLYFSSTAEAVLSNAPCPIMTVGSRAAAAMYAPGTHPQPNPLSPATPSPSKGPVVFATDFNSTTLPAIAYARSFRQNTTLPLYCLHVLPRSLESTCSQNSLPLVLNLGLRHLAGENPAIEPAPVCATRYGSDISNAIAVYAAEQNAKLVVLGVNQSSIMKAHLPAHITFRIITEAPCPVVTMAYSSNPHTPALIV